MPARFSMLTAFGFPLRLLWAAVWEEALFRGWLQPVLSKRWHDRRPLPGLTAANLATSAVFAALHLLAQPPQLAPGYFALSLALGMVRERTGSVAAAIALHAVFNLVWWGYAA